MPMNPRLLRPAKRKSGLQPSTLVTASGEVLRTQDGSPLRAIQNA